MIQPWPERLRLWICARIGHRWRPSLDEHEKPYPNMNTCRRCKALDSPDKTRYATGELKSNYA